MRVKECLLRLVGFKPTSEDYGPNNLQWLRHQELKAMVDLHFETASINTADESFLDVGCGSGWLLENFVSDTRRLVGCDWVEAGNFLHFNYVKIDLNNDGLNPLGDDLFDVIICSDVLEHMENPAKIISEMSRHLAPEGRIFVSIPNVWNVLERLRFLAKGKFRRYRSERNSAPWGHISIFTVDTLESLCDRAGLNIETVAGGASQGHMAFAGFFKTVRPSLLFSYNAYLVLKKAN